MSFFIYTPDFKNRHEISHALSIRSSTMYNGIGKFTMILPINEYNIKNVLNDSLILNIKTGETYFVNNKKDDTRNNQIVINGYTSNSLLNRRVVWKETKIKNLEADIYKLINDNARGLEHFKTAEAKGLPDKIESVISCGQLLDGCIRLLNVADAGHRMRWDDDTRTLSFEIYKGQDRTEGIHAAVFSYERGTAKNLVISDDVSLFQNTYYISGKLTDGTEIVEIVGDENTGNARREKWVREVPMQEAEETAEAFRARLREKAIVAAVKNTRRQNFSVEINAEDIGKKYNLGDIISCVSTKFRVQFNARITGLNYALDVNGEKTSLVLGEPNISIIEEVKMQNE